MTLSYKEYLLTRRTAAFGLASSAFVPGRSARAQTNAEKLDTDEGGYPLDAAALEHLRWWTTPESVTRTYVGRAGSQMHVRFAQPDHPRQTPVLLLHDAGLSGRVWDQVMPSLAQDRAVLAPDLLAHGDSDGDPNASVGQHVSAISNFVDASGIEQVDVVGIGLGAHVALTFAAMRPARVGRLVVSKTHLPSQASPRPDPADPENPDFLMTAWTTFMRGYAQNAPLGLRDRDFADLLRSRAATPRDNGALGVATQVAQPVLVLQLGPDEGAVSLAGSLPAGMQTVRDDWTVQAPSLRTKEWIGVVISFLDQDAAAQDVDPVVLPRSTPEHGGIIRQFMTTPGGQMHYRLMQGRDDGPPLLCFHMSPRSGAYYEPLMSALNVSGRTVIAVDTAGYGESFKPPDWLNVPGYAGHMANFIDALGVPDVDLMGDHTGSKIAIATSQQRPGKVRRIVMNTAGVYSVEEQKGWQTRMAAIDVAADGSHYPALWERYNRLNRGKLDWRQNAFRFYETVRAGPCMWWGSRAANLYILGEVLPTIEHEILLVCSDEDSLIEPTRRGVPLLRNGRYVEFKGQGNSMVEYRAAVVAPTIARFLEA